MTDIQARQAPPLGDLGAEAFRLLFEASPDILLVLLPDSPRFTMVAATNARLEATHTTRESLGRSLFEEFPDNPDDPQATGMSNLRVSLERVLATRAPDTMTVQKYDIRGPDGRFQVKYWSPKNLPVLSPSGEVLYILHRVEDVTDLVRATELGDELRGQNRTMEREVIRRSHELSVANNGLREANAKLGQLDAAKTAFFSNISHEFRTPLTLMLGPIEDALAQPDAVLQGETLRAVHRSTVRLLRLVNSLLDFSRIEAGRAQASFERTDLAALTEGLAGSFRSIIESAGMRLIVDCPRPQAPVYVDPSHWEKIVLNLLSNAFKFTFEGEISVRLREQGDRVELSVSDTGAGIPEPELPRIFERFHRVEGIRGRSFEGTGIGLALVQDLAGLHGGSARVASVVGRGSTFTVSIPTGCDHLPRESVVADRETPRGAAPVVSEASRWLVEKHATSAAFPPGAGASTGPLAPGVDTRDRPRLLVVDDNADMRAYLSRILGPHWPVDTAVDGEEALALVSRDLPDLVLSDVMMPNMDGISFLRALRASPRTRHVPVILLSARAGEDASVEGLDTGADDYLIKPFSARDLLARVRTHLGAARARTSALRASEARFRRLAESGMIGICISDDESRIVEANNAFLQMVGYTREELLSGTISWGLLLPGERGASPPGASPHASRPWEGELVCKDGRRLSALVAHAPLDGHERLSLFLDLSEQRRLESQIRQAQKMEAVGRLAGGVAHDFNNILSVILSYAEILGAELEPDEPLLAEVEEIKTAAERAADLTRQLLAFSRQEVCEPKVLSLNQSVSGMEKMLRRLLGADVRFSTLLDAEAGNIVADPGQIEQVIMNLAINARDATPQGGMVTVQTSSVVLDEDYAQAHLGVKPGVHVMLAVSDTGCGMDAQTQSRIFEPFFTTKEKGKGTGLGLAIVFGIVKQSHGHIWVYSEPGKGTTFKVYFPRVGTPAREHLPRRSPPGPVRGDETILLAEDDSQVRAMAKAILLQNGYVVLEASSGGEALSLCERYEARIDLLLTDVILPQMSGRQLAERLNLLRPGIQMIFMSGYTDGAIVQHGVLDSGVAYLQKPLTPTPLLRKVREALDRRSPQRQ